jgi:hypothetical protein
MKVEEAKIIKSKIRRGCCVCNIFLGYKNAEGISSEKISHGYCDKCFDKLMKEIKGR